MSVLTDKNVRPTDGPTSPYGGASQIAAQLAEDFSAALAPMGVGGGPLVRRTHPHGDVQLTWLLRIAPLQKKFDIHDVMLPAQTEPRGDARRRMTIGRGSQADADSSRH